ncbi:MAG: spore cortex biosynthesis protein YabQ [Oscillospiraceae bacterium]|jgi:hypothetical protein|nr:spore cortex biosynthesis protein YabQ [Oscillospiraceae bacterium]
MEYLPGLAVQTRLFLLSLGFGFALGIFYDVFRVLRLLFTRKGGVLLLQDILYSLCCTLLSFFFFLAVSDGSMRAYTIFGEILGWLVYYFSLGAAAVKLTEALVWRLKKSAIWVRSRVISPVLGFAHRLLRPIHTNSSKCTRVLKKKLRFHLQTTMHLLYNDTNIKSKRKKGQEGFADAIPTADFTAQSNRKAAKISPLSPQARGELGVGRVRHSGVRSVRRYKNPQERGRNGSNQSRKRPVPQTDRVAAG